jgi:ArsR family transcriptional regulator
MRRAAEVLKCLGHPLRIEIVSLLGKGEMNVRDLGKRLDIQQSIVSQQLGILKAKKIVLARREKNSVYYSLADTTILGLLECMSRCQKKYV